MMQKEILIFTPKAISHIADKISEKPGSVFRVCVTTTGCNGYMYQPAIELEALPDDIQVKIDGPFSVFVAESAVDIVRGSVVDYVEKSFGMKQLTFDNSNAEGMCGCGESFNLKKDDV